MGRSGSVTNASIKIEIEDEIKGHKFDREFIFGPAKNGQKDFEDINWVYCTMKV